MRVTPSFSAYSRRVLPANRLVVAPNGEQIVQFSFEEEGRLLIGRWLGYCTADNVVLGMTTALQMLREYPCPAILSDGSGVVGDWSDLVPWMQYELLPQIINLGVRYTANVRSRDMGGRLAHVEYAQFAAGYIYVQLFDDPALARQWLLEQLRPLQASSALTATARA